MLCSVLYFQFLNVHVQFARINEHDWVDAHFQTVLTFLSNILEILSLWQLLLLPVHLMCAYFAGKLDDPWPFLTIQVVFLVHPYAVPTTKVITEKKNLLPILSTQQLKITVTRAVHIHIHMYWMYKHSHIAATYVCSFTPSHIIKPTNLNAGVVGVWLASWWVGEQNVLRFQVPVDYAFGLQDPHGPCNLLQENPDSILAQRAFGCGATRGK